MLISCCVYPLASPHLMFSKPANPFFHSAASAIAANTFLRSLAASVFPLFATYMFDALKVNWTGTLLGFVALALVPIPVLFYKYGEKLRARSSFAPMPKFSSPVADDAE